LRTGKICLWRRRTWELPRSSRRALRIPRTPGASRSVGLHRPDLADQVHWLGLEIRVVPRGRLHDPGLVREDHGLPNLEGGLRVQDPLQGGGNIRGPA
jgi:hypothetical protein